MIVLGLDASSDAVAVGLVSDGTLLCEYTIHNGKNHSLTLLSMVETMLAEVNMDFCDIDVYACGVGPGSFTGVRIGAATVKAFAQAHKKPVVAVSSLAVLAENLGGYDGLKVSAIHARVNELYCAAFGPSGEEVLSPTVMTVEELIAYLSDKQCKIVGSGAIMFKEQFEEKLGKGAVAEAGRVHSICGGAVAELGYRLAIAGKEIPYGDLAPVYLRASQAEREYAEKHKAQ
ncbi:MAG: tRNA (adenosine(37)-N6)-threonylcarbamoyltransferase complex dimerization subunit type 1 TsaB [Clostridia bacterium]|nr:tRNA (adenosine(37)-N6)-threonylcarbamoyltransferase complex dimerization subunit type 1 TsaB [Clostridia bacterium]